MKRFLSLEWDAIAGILAAVIATVLHLFHVVDQGILFSIMLALIALLFIRDLRRDAKSDKVSESVHATAASIRNIQSALALPDVLLIGPRELRASSARFSEEARGEMIWFNVCLLMFKPQSLFDDLLKPAIENPLVSSILFILNEKDREFWSREVMPKAISCSGHKKLLEPQWRKMNESVSFILSDRAEGGTEALLSFWGEPFMSQSTGKDVPRYIFHVQKNSELLVRLSEMERSYRLTT